MLQVPTSPVPSISISFAPSELPLEEPKSPFSTVSFPQEPDSPRPQYLSPPCVMSPTQVLRAQRRGELSPLSPLSPNHGKGLERARFEALLKASKERSAMVGAKKPVELRKEIAIKAQKAKQFERRARFLSKLVAPPSPTAADLPVTPPDSPAVFHFTLPSPGLQSPLELFETLANNPELYYTKTRIEQVDFRLPHQKQEAARKARFAVSGSMEPSPLPSLDQISQRLRKSSTSITTCRSPSPEQESTQSSRLPNFLRSRSPSPELAKKPRPLLSPIAVRHVAKPTGIAIRTPTPIATINSAFLPAFPPSPTSPQSKLQITTTICPPTRSKSSPTEFTEENITEFGTKHSAVLNRTSPRTMTAEAEVSKGRAQATKDLFNKLSRRTPGLPGSAIRGIRAQDDTSSTLSPRGIEDKLRRRKTAPAELSPKRAIQRHPILDKPGGF